MLILCFYGLSFLTIFKDSLIHEQKAVNATDQIIDTSVPRLSNDLISILAISPCVQRWGHPGYLAGEVAWTFLMKRNPLYLTPCENCQSFFFQRDCWPPHCRMEYKSSEIKSIILRGVFCTWKLQMLHYYLETLVLKSHQTMKLSRKPPNHCPKEADIIQLVVASQAICATIQKTPSRNHTVVHKWVERCLLHKTPETQSSRSCGQSHTTVWP